MRLKTKIATIMTLLSILGSSPLLANNDKANDDGLYGFVGFGIGRTGVSNDSLNPDSSGALFDMKALASYYRSTHILDIGLGWFYTDVDNDFRSITTKSVFLEAGARYRFNKHWSAGPTLMGAIANDNTFSMIEDKKSSEMFLGIRGEYEPDFFVSNKMRINLAYQRDISIDDRSVSMLTLGIQFGMPFSGGKVREKVVYKTKYIPTIVKTSKNSLKATFDGNKGLYFKTNSDKANKYMAKYLERLAFFLKKYSNQWKSIEVGGHTDSRGSLAFNMRLSQKRANKVKSYIVAEGITPSRIKAIGYGPKAPVDLSKTNLGYARNRRVEIEFKGIKDVDSFYSSLAIIQ